MQRSLTFKLCFVDTTYSVILLQAVIPSNNICLRQISEHLQPYTYYYCYLLVLDRELQNYDKSSKYVHISLELDNKSRVNEGKKIELWFSQNFEAKL